MNRVYKAETFKFERNFWNQKVVNKAVLYSNSLAGAVTGGGLEATEKGHRAD